MYVCHEEFGWGKIVHHDIEGKTAEVDFTDYPYGEEKIETVQMKDLLNPYAVFKGMVESSKKKMDDFIVLPIIVYRDRMNDGYYNAYDEMVCIPKTIANQVHYAMINFTMTSVKFYDVNGEILLTTTTSGYVELEELEAFIA